MTRRSVTLWFSALVILAQAPAAAHVPHDVVSALALSPSYADDNTVFAVARTNLLRSTDGGQNWSRLTRGLPVAATTITISPRFALDGVVWVGSGGGVYRSEDRGSTWSTTRLKRPIKQLVSSPRSAGVVLALGKGGALFQTTDGGGKWKRVVLPKVGVSKVHWSRGLLLAGSSSGETFRSFDGGKTWVRFAQQVPGGPRINAIVAVSRQRTLLGTDAGLFVVSSKGAPAAVTVGVSEEAITGLAVLDEPGAPALLATTYHAAVFKSTDGGSSWHRFDDGLTTDPQSVIERVPDFSHIATAAGGAVMVGSFTGVFESRDFGRTWQKRYALPSSIIVGLTVGSGSGGSDTVALATYGGGIRSKVMDSSTWQRSVPNARLGAIASSPAFAQDHVMLTGTFDRVLRSSDGGSSWSDAKVEYPAPVLPRSGCPAGVATEPPAELVARAPRLFSFQFPFDFAFSPAFGEDRTVFAAYRPEGVLRSLDGGLTFTKIWDGCGWPVQSLAISPAFASDQTLFAYSAGGLYRSRNAGKRWKRLWANQGKIFLGISPRFAQDQTVYAAGTSGLWRSQNAGVTWESIPIAGKRRAIAVGGFAVSPFPGPTRELLVQTYAGEFYVCRDGEDGFEARAVATPDEFAQMRGFDRDRVPLLAFSSAYPTDGTLYAASMDRLYRSTDRGQSWAVVPSGDLVQTSPAH